MRIRFPITSRHPTPALQSLFALQEYSLARYAAQAQLHAESKADESLAVINDIAKDQAIFASRIGELLTSRREPVEHAGFPLTYTALNDLSANYVARLLFRRQPELIEDIAECLASLNGDLEGHQVARDVLASETSHLERLRGIVGENEVEALDFAIAA